MTKLKERTNSDAPFQIYYIGLRGEFTKTSREAVVITNYEIAANPADHKNRLLEGAGSQIS